MERSNSRQSRRSRSSRGRSSRSKSESVNRHKPHRHKEQFDTRRTGHFREQRTSKRQPFEVLLDLGENFLDHILQDGSKVFSNLKNKVPASEFLIREVEAGDKQPTKIIKVFDNSEERKWESVNMALDSFFEFQSEGQSKENVNFSTIILVPASKIRPFERFYS